MALALATMTTSASAQNLTIQFSDGTPKNRNTVTNVGCPIANAMIMLDLEESDGKLTFETTSQGAAS